MGIADMKKAVRCARAEGKDLLAPFANARRAHAAIAARPSFQATMPPKG